jgi:diguanylate cyclase (GGDEF)-like protein/PAS domain S-box-containing protein
VLSGICDELRRGGYRALVVQTVDARVEDQHLDTSRYDAPLGWDRVEGFLAFGNAVSERYLARLAGTGKPLVVAFGEARDAACPSVQADNAGGVRDAVTDLIRHGHERIGFVGSLRNSDFRERHEAYRATLLDAGLVPDGRFYHDTDSYLRAGGLATARTLLEQGMPVTAMVAGNDELALGLLAGLARAGLQAPHDLAVVGFDDTEAAAGAGLSTVSQHVERLGARAAGMVLAAIAGESPAAGMHRLPTSFVPRGSCGCEWGSGVVGTGHTHPRDAFTDVLRGGLGDTAGAARAADALADAFEDGRRDRLEAAVAEVYARYPRPESLDLVVSAVQAHRRVAGSTGEHPDAERRLIRSLADVISRRALDRSGRLQTMLRDTFDIGVDLLSDPAGWAGSLDWLGRTPVRAAAVSLWDDARERVVPAGVFVRGAGPEPEPGPAVPLAAFPPEPVLRDGTDPVFCLPVATPNRDWGVIALAGPVETDTATGRETYVQWAAVLGVALDRRDLLERERVLQEDIRTSQERYALATESAGAGMWDWDFEAGTVFYCSRWRSLVGPHRDGIGDAPEEWLSRVHPDDRPALEAALEQARRGEQRLHLEHRIRSADGSYRWMLARAVAVGGGSDGAPSRLVGSLTDVTERRELEDQLRHQALFDPLTGLPNRTLFFDRVERAIAHAGRRPDTDFAVLFLDLDGFKVVNDSLGHLAGDQLLVQVAERLQSCLRASDTASRVGGDEFAVLLSDASDLTAVREAAQRLQARLGEPYELPGHQVVVSASIGITIGQGDYSRPEEMLRDADIAMYRAKSRERGGHTVFDPAMYEGAVHRLRMESDLRQGMDDDTLHPYYQPIVDLRTGEAVGLEALARWQHPARGIVPPGDFLPIAEETGLIVPLGRRLLHAVCHDLLAFKCDDLLPGRARVSVNVSNREFWQHDLLEQLDETLARCHMPAEWLTLEITEGVVMGNAEQARGILLELRARGLHLHIDDFGTGYSSLQALHRFPIQALKIDRSFVARLDSEHASRELVRTMTQMAANLGFEVIAEGIESPRQRDLLGELGCDFGQGFWFGRPADSVKTGDALRLAQQVAGSTTVSTAD